LSIHSRKHIFVTLFFSLFATITGVGLVVPLLPVYAHDLGAKGFYIALIFSAFSLSRTCLLPVFGRLSDRKGRKPFIVTGLAAYALVSIAFLLATNVTQLITIRFFQGMASAMVLPVIQAYVGDITPAGKEGTTMGLFNMSLFLGLSLGPLAGGLLNDHFSLDAAFICMGILGAIGFAGSLILLPSRASEVSSRKQRQPSQWRTILRDRIIVGLFSFRFAYTACIGVIWAFLPVYADIEFSLSSSRIGVLVMLGVLISGAIQTPMGWLADHFDRKIMVTVGGLLVVASVVFYNLAETQMHLVLGSILFGLGGGISMPAMMAMTVLKGHQNKSMGSVMAIITMGHSLGMLVGALLGGLMMDWFQLHSAFGLAGGTMVAGIIVFAICVRGIPMNAEKASGEEELK
jgi:MFS family permease